MKSGRITHALAPLLIAATGIAVYSNCFGGVFLYDDVSALVRSPSIRAFPDCVAGSSRPLVFLTFWLNYALGGYHVWHWHLVNLMFHIAAGLLLYGIVRRTVLLQAIRGANSDDPSGCDRLSLDAVDPLPALAIALIWLVHPLQTQSVTYIAQRAESMTALFYFGTLYCFTRSAGNPRSGPWLAWSAIICALGMAAKPVMVTAPLAVLLYDRAFVSRSFRSAIGGKPMYYAAIAATLLASAVLLTRQTESSMTAGFGAKILSPPAYLKTQVGGVITHYLKLVFAPHPLCMNYGWQEPDSALTITLNSLPVLALLGIAVLTFRTVPILGFPATWFLVNIATSSSVIPVADYAVEHRMYLPLAGLVALAVAATSILCRAAARRRLSFVCRAAAILLMIAAVAVLGVMTYRRNNDYHSAERMWSSAVDCRPDSHGARINLCGELIASGRHADAERHCEYIIDRLAHFAGSGAAEAERRQHGDRGFEFGRRLSYYVKAHVDMGIIRMKQDRLDDAERHLREAVRLMPRDVDARWNLVLLAKARKDPAACMTELETVLNLDPGHPLANSAMGMIALQRGDVDQAADHFQKTLVRIPCHTRSLYQLAVIYASSADTQLRNPGEALRLARRLSDRSGDDPVVLRLLAVCHAAAGDLASAIRAARQAQAMAEQRGDNRLAADIDREIEACNLNLARTNHPGSSFTADE